MDFTLFSTDYLYDMYMCGLIPDEEVIHLYSELTNRNEKYNPVFIEIEKNILAWSNKRRFYKPNLEIQKVQNKPTTSSNSNALISSTRNISNVPRNCSVGEFSNSCNNILSSDHLNDDATTNWAIAGPSSTNIPSHQSRFSPFVRLGRDSKYVKIMSQEEKEFKRFGIKKRAMSFKFTEPMSDNPLQFIKNGISELLNVATSDVEYEDYVGLVITSTESPDRPVAISFRKMHQLNVDVIMKFVAAGHQSNAGFFGNGVLVLNLHTVQLPRGMGRNGRRTQLSKLEYCEFILSKKSALFVNNFDNYCLAYALVLAIAFKTKASELKELSKCSSLLKSRVLQLCRHCNVDLTNGATYEHIRQFQDHLTEFTIVVYNDRRGKSTYFEGPRTQTRTVLNLFMENEHYDVIKSLTGFFCCAYFCELCKVKYNHKNQHSNCPFKCSSCHKTPMCDSNQVSIFCNKCNRAFSGQACFNHHRMSLCDALKQCTKCLNDIWVNNKKKHRCGYKYCFTCKQVLNINHFCYIQPDELSHTKLEDRKKFLFIFYDIESMQETKLDLCNGYLHEANLLVSQQVCSHCINNNNIADPCYNCGTIRQHIFTENPVDEFLNYVARVNSLGKFKIVVIAHNMKGYDGCFILKSMLANTGRWNPKIIRTGTKIISITCGNNIKFIDSLNFLPLPLSKLPSTFNFKGAKGYFPHLFNTTKNKNYVGPIPPLQFYAPDDMKSDDRTEFLTWYNEQVKNNVIFNMSHEMVKYCIADVYILRTACIIFRECFLSSNNVDPFLESTTIASACNLVFRRNFLRPHTIGISPKGGYRLAGNQSQIALKWLFWLERSLNIDIQHAGNGREVKLSNGVFVDGYSEDNNTVYQFHGCFFHGCVKCFPNQVESISDRNELMLTRRERTMAAEKWIKKSGYNLVTTWECDFRNEIKTNVELKTFILENPDLFNKEPLNPRDSFFGGRTNAVRLYHKTSGDEKICYLDVCSLYPYVNKYGKYPVGHPKITVGRKECEKVDINAVEGIIKCVVLPPQDLYHPVLPYRCDGKLTFPLCRTCVETKCQEDCHHQDDERKFVGTYVADELRKAIEKRYIVLEILEIWEYSVEKYDPETKTGGLFTGYVNNFLKQKVESSGWPTWCSTDADKSAYIKQYLQREGVELEPKNITHNPGLRYISKLMLNSFWGKFGQRENMMQSTIISDPSDFFKLLTDALIVVHNITIFSDDVIVVTWNRTDEHVTPLKTVSVAVAAYTTAAARLELYKYLEVLDRRVLYFDTDSVIFTQKAGEWMPPTGDFLGELTDEIQEYGAGSYISEFVSGGPKNYAFQVKSPSKNTTICKVKGITLNYKNSNIVNFEAMRNLVINPTADATLTVFNDRKIVTSATYELMSVSQSKTYRTNYTKRRRIENFDTLPYGFRLSDV